MNDRFGIVYPKVKSYLYGLLRPRDALLTEIEKDAEENDVPIIGPLAGSVLTMIAARAKRGLEIGTATGYSGILLGRPISRNSGRLITIERDPTKYRIAQRNFQRAGIAKSVRILEGDAKVIVTEMAKKQNKFDLIFLDVGEKSLYIDLFEPCISLLRKGGYLIADNALSGGQVAEPSDKDINVVATRKFNKMVYSDKRLLPLIIPLRDGVMVALKVSTR